MTQRETLIEELLKKPYWIIDILPKQVPADSAGQYFTVEEYYRKEPQIFVIREKQLNVLLKLNCYQDLFVEELKKENPAPEELKEALQSRYLNILAGNALIVSDPGDTYMTLYGPEEELLSLIRILAAAEGLFVWKGKDEWEIR